MSRVIRQKRGRVLRSTYALSAGADPIAPATTSAPAWGAGVFQVGEAVAITAGTYAGSDPITVERRVEGFSSITGEWSVLATGVGLTYTIGFADTFATGIRVVEVATNAAGSVTAEGDSRQAYAAGSVPVLITSPDTTIEGTLDVGGVVGTTEGDWDPQGATLTGFEYRYLRDLSEIAGETSATYALTADDQGTTFTPQRRALSAAGASLWASADAVSVPAAASGGPANDGTIYPADLTLYATDDPDSILVGSPTFHGDGSVELTIAAGAAQTRDRGVTFFFELATDSQGRTWPVDIDAGPPVGACVAGIETVAGSGDLSADIPDAAVPDGTYVRVGTGLVWATGAAPTSLLTSNSWVAWGVRTESGGVSSLVRSLYMSDSTEQTSPSDALPSAAGAYGALGARPTNNRRAVLQRGGAGTFRPNGDSLDVDTFNSNVFPAAFAQCFITVSRYETLTGNRTIRIKPFLHLVLLDPPGDPV